MTVWAISDLHLAFGVPSKSMEVFGELWHGYAQKIESNWKDLVKPDDLVLIPGDISWGLKLEEALVDLNWIDKLPGTKVLIRGNHDYWWASKAKLQTIMPPSIHFIHNDAFLWNGIAIGGVRLWDSPEYNFDAIVHFQENPRARKKTSEEKEKEKKEAEKIFTRDLERLKLSLDQLDPSANVRIALTHYPPIGLDLKPSRASALLEHYKINHCLFGHLHNIKTEEPLFGAARGVHYALTSCDYLNFVPLKVTKT